MRTVQTSWTLFQHGPRDLGRRLSDSTSALRADGSRSTVSRQAGTWFFEPDDIEERPARLIVFAPEGARVEVDDTRRRVVYSKPLNAGLLDDGLCSGKVQWMRKAFDLRATGRGSRLGVATVRWKGSVRSLGRIESMTWELAPSLDCATLYERQTFRWEGAWLPYHVRVAQAESVTFGEPDPALFAIPKDYRQVMPRASISLPHE